MSFLAGELFEDVASRMGEWRVKEQVEILRVWDRDGGVWCRCVESFICQV